MAGTIGKGGSDMDWPKRTTTRLSLDSDELVPTVGDLYRYWLSVKPPDAIGPAWGAAFKLVNLPGETLANMVVVDVIDAASKNLVYRYWGSQRGVFMQSGDPTGKPLATGLLSPVKDMILDQYGDVVSTGQPLLALNEYELKSGLIAECQTIRLPLSSDGRTVDKVVSVTEFLRHKDEYQDAEDAYRQTGN
jgi:hypothetical protein